jgi:hypothetical protein
MLAAPEARLMTRTSNIYEVNAKDAQVIDHVTMPTTIPAIHTVTGCKRTGPWKGEEDEIMGRITCDEGKYMIRDVWA